MTKQEIDQLYFEGLNLLLYAEFEKALEIFDMGCDFSIEKCARRYMELYRGLR